MVEPTLFIIDDDNELCKSLHDFMATIELPVEIFNTPQRYLDAYNSNRRGCLLVDVCLPQMSGLELQKRLNELHNPLPIIFMTGYGDIDMAVEAMKHGAFDFVTKPFKEQLLLNKIQQAIAKDSQRPFLENSALWKQRLNSLTKREYEVLQRIIAGKSNKATAKTLGVSCKTVEMHRGNILKKMQVKSAVELTRVCIALGMPLS
jgi:FixJ family two-component response regulator